MQPDMENKPLMEADGIAGLIEDLARKILAEYSDPKETPFILIGIHRGGVPLANRLAEVIGAIAGTRPETGSIDITLYRDDIGMRKTLPPIYETVIPAIDANVVILVDSIVQTGRSVRAALDAITDFGRPAKVRLATLFDRGNRDFPIRPDYVGRELDVDPAHRVSIRWEEHTQMPDAVTLTAKKRFS